MAPATPPPAQPLDPYWTLHELRKKIGDVMTKVMEARTYCDEIKDLTPVANYDLKAGELTLAVYHIKEANVHATNTIHYLDGVLNKIILKHATDVANQEFEDEMNGVKVDEIN